MVKIPKSIHTEPTQTNIEIALERVSSKREREREREANSQGMHSFIKVKATEIKKNNDDDEGERVSEIGRWIDKESRKERANVRTNERL